MDKDLYQNLIDVISNHYPVVDIKASRIGKIVADKINRIEDPSVFKSLCDDFEALGAVEDYSFFQFPNNKLILEEIETTGIYTLVKDFSVCISLLCPYYTYFYEYRFLAKTGKGPIQLANICFLKDRKFSGIKQDINLEKVDSLIKARFPRHTYVDHYVLLANEVEKGLPFGGYLTDKTKFSILRYLFDLCEFDQYHL